LDGDGNGVGGDAYTIVGSEANGFARLIANWNGDSGVSVFDFTTFSYWFGLGVPIAPKYADVNEDDGVSVFDFTPFSTNFSKEVIYPTAFAPLIRSQDPLRAVEVSQETEPVVAIVRSPIEPARELQRRELMADEIMQFESEEVDELDWALEAIAADVAGLGLN